MDIQIFGIKLPFISASEEKTVYYMSDISFFFLLYTILSVTDFLPYMTSHTITHYVILMMT